MSRRRQYNEMGDSIVQIFRALQRYKSAYEGAYGSPIGDDAVIGDEGWLPIAKAMIRLLDGETGDRDPGELDGHIRDLVLEAGFTEKELDAA